LRWENILPALWLFYVLSIDFFVEKEKRAELMRFSKIISSGIMKQQLLKTAVIKSGSINKSV
jgi:hypothetical protein